MSVAELPTFEAASYDLPIPKDESTGRKATKLTVRWTGSTELDRTSEDDLLWLQALRLGTPLRLVIVGTPTARGFSISPKPGRDVTEELGFTCSIKVEQVELGELA